MSQILTESIGYSINSSSNSISNILPLIEDRDRLGDPSYSGYSEMMNINSHQYQSQSYLPPYHPSSNNYYEPIEFFQTISLEPHRETDEDGEERDPSSPLITFPDYACLSPSIFTDETPSTPIIIQSSSQLQPSTSNTTPTLINENQLTPILPQNRVFEEIGTSFNGWPWDYWPEIEPANNPSTSTEIPKKTQTKEKKDKKKRGRKEIYPGTRKEKNKLSRDRSRQELRQIHHDIEKFSMEIASHRLWFSDLASRFSCGYDMIRSTPNDTESSQQVLRIVQGLEILAAKLSERHRKNGRRTKGKIGKKQQN